MGHALVFCAGLGVSALVAGAAVAVAGGPTDDRLKRDLEAVARLRVLFGHQSVGANVLEGVARLSASAGVPVRVSEVAGGAGAVPSPGLAHLYVGVNGDPRSKMAAFDRALPAGAGFDVALLKFCYVDIDASTDVPRLFADYQSTLRAVQARNPGTVVVHVTAPLRSGQGALRSALKRLLGRGQGVVADNERREQFNALLREAYQGRAPIFDLALAEATRPDGTRETAARDGRAVPMLVPAYTDDGAHLNASGQDRAARELLRVLAALPAAREGNP
jgi:hypothetical protein